MTTDSSETNNHNTASSKLVLADQNSAGRIAAGRAVYARNLRLSEVEAEALMSERAGTQFTTEAFLAAGGPGWSSKALSDRDRSIAVIAALVSQHVPTTG